MKTDFARPPATRYRNEAVFRSAQRLIASAPAKPAPRRPAHWLVFTGGLALGAALVFYAPALWRGFIALVAVDQAPIVVIARPVARKGNAVRPPPTTTIPHFAPPAIPPAPAESLPAPTPSVATPPPAVEPGRRTWQITTTSRAAGSASTAGEVTTTTRFVTEIKLQGEMRADGAPSVFAVEFVLHRLIAGDGSTIRGTMRLPQTVLGNPVNNVAGSIRGNTITMQSADAEYRPTPGLFRLTIELPSDNRKPEIAGSWTFGGLHGTLALTIVPPPF